MENLRKQLVAKKNSLLQEAKVEIKKQLNGEYREAMLDAVGEDGNGACDFEDLSFQVLNAKRKLLLEIEDALLMIKEGTYGFCAECGEKINEKRLLAMPCATLCIICKDAEEKEAKGYQID